MKRTKTYTLELREEAVKLVLAQGLMLEETATRIAIQKGTLANWVSTAKRGTTPNVAPGSRTVPELEAENAKLRMELAEARMERDIVKKRRGTLRGSRCQVRGHEGVATQISDCRDVPRVWGFAQWLLHLGEWNVVAACAGR